MKSKLLELKKQIDDLLGEYDEEEEEEDSDEFPTFEDEDGDLIHVLPRVAFTGDIPSDMAQINADEELADWAYGELQSDEGVTDASRETVYWGWDVQDNLTDLPNLDEMEIA
jgi:hypothetical protein